MEREVRRFTKRRRRFEAADEARYLTFSCQGRLALFQNDAIKRAFVGHLTTTRVLTGFKLFAWVIMPEHVHLLILPRLPEWPMPRLLVQVKGGFANLVLRRWRALGAPILDRLVDGAGKPRFWLPGGGYDRNIFLGPELIEKVSYIHNNPVVRGLVSDPLDYVWSSASWYSHRRDKALIQIDNWWNPGVASS